MDIDHTIEPVRSALQQAGIKTREISGSTLEARELAGATIVRVHSLSTPHEQASTLIDLPTKTGRCMGDNPSALCIGPREWLFISDTARPSELMTHLQSTLKPEGTAIYDNSDGLAVFRLSGEGAPWLLSKFSGLDYLSGHSSCQHCARTKMEHVAVVVHYHEAEGGQFVFDLIFDRSIARYLWELLTESAPHADDLAREYGSAA